MRATTIGEKKRPQISRRAGRGKWKDLVAEEIKRRNIVIIILKSKF